MGMRRNWNQIEVDAIINDYFSMLEKELLGQSFRKVDHSVFLSTQLQDRSRPAIERKHQNISAILIELGFPWISGYKPLGNYQSLLRDRLVVHLQENSRLAAVAAQAVDAPLSELPLESVLQRKVDPPERGEFEYVIREPFSIASISTRVDYLEREARNASLGRNGEMFVLEFERARLRDLGKYSLADKVEHVSETVGNCAGFDVRSFEVDGTDRFIEVKSTAFGKETPFYVTRNELMVSKERQERYHLYRVFYVRKYAQLYMLNGALDRLFQLDATQYRATR